jgi:hypothetical protein
MYLLKPITYRCVPIYRKIILNGYIRLFCDLVSTADVMERRMSCDNVVDYPFFNDRPEMSNFL